MTSAELQIEEAEDQGEIIRRPFPEIDWHQAWAEQPEDVDWLIEDHIERGRLIAVFSGPGVGKSLLVGAMRGTYIPGPESPTPIDTGRAVITDQRVTFAGMKASREWQYAKLIGCQHDPDNWTVLQVSNRQKASGIGYDEEHAEDIRFRLDLAIATFTRRRPAIDQIVQGQLNELLAGEPALPPAPEPAVVIGQIAAAPPQLPPPGWYPDNGDLTLQRYWDGAQWTEHTAPR